MNQHGKKYEFLTANFKNVKVPFLTYPIDVIIEEQNVPRNELEIQTETVGNATILILDGPVDSATTDAFKKAVDALAARPGAKIVLDCTNLTYLNSRAIGLLVGYHRRVIATRGLFTMCNLNAKLVKTLELMQIGKSLLIYDTREQAMELM